MKIKQVRNQQTDLIPLPHAVVFLEEALVVRDAVFAVDEAVMRGIGSALGVLGSNWRRRSFS